MGMNSQSRCVAHRGTFSLDEENRLQQVTMVWMKDLHHFQKVALRREDLK